MNDRDWLAIEHPEIRLMPHQERLFLDMLQSLREKLDGPSSVTKAEARSFFQGLRTGKSTLLAMIELRLMGDDFWSNPEVKIPVWRMVENLEKTHKMFPINFSSRKKKF